MKKIFKLFAAFAMAAAMFAACEDPATPTPPGPTPPGPETEKPGTEKPALKADFTFTAEALTVKFTNASEGAEAYLWNFGEKKEATGKAVKWQLDWYREKMLLGEAEGVVLHTNTMADLDYEAYDVAVEWMEKHGDEEI